MKELISFFSSKSKLLILMLSVSILLIVGGYLYYISEEESIRKIKYNQLESLASIKVNQVSEWYTDEVDDAYFIAHDIILVETLQNYFVSGSAESKTNVKKLLRSMSEQHAYDDILVASLSGKTLFSAKQNKPDINPFFQDKIIEALKSNTIIPIDIYRMDSDKVYLDLISPVVIDREQKMAALIFRIDIHKHLYPLLKNLPATAPSLEIFLVRKEGNTVEILSELKFSDNKNHINIYPLSHDYLPSVRAVTGHSDIYEGEGYTGHDVLAHLSQVPSTPWFMVAQIDQSEVYADITYRAGTILIFTIVLIFVVGTGLVSIYNRILYQKEKELWQSKERFKLTLDSIGEGVITANLNGTIEYLNKFAEVLTGWHLKEAAGKKFGEVYSVVNEITGNKEDNYIERILKKGIIKELGNHTLLISKKGRRIPVMDTGAPIHNKEGQITGIVVVFKDETFKREQQRILQESEERLRATLDNMLEGCQVLGRDWSYIYVNNAAAKHGKNKKEYLIGKKITDVYPGIQNTHLFEVMQRCMNGNTSELLENEFTFPDGSTGWFELSIQSTSEGIFILSQDITERKQGELELIRAKELAEEMNRIKSNFFSNMSHEMRTPLVAILGFADMLKENLKDSEELIEMTEFIKKGGERLLETVNLVLNISEIQSDATEIKTKEVNIVPMLRDLTGLYSYEAFRRDLTFKFITNEEQIICNIDEHLFRNIFTNLLKNAFKYTETGSISIKVEAMTSNVLVKIIDTGIGIPQEKKHVIWEEFRQVSEGLNRKYQGTGLGLTLTKKYIELLGGKIDVESTEGEGTVFIVEFPRITKEASILN